MTWLPILLTLSLLLSHVTEATEDVYAFSLDPPADKWGFNNFLNYFVRGSVLAKRLGRDIAGPFRTSTFCKQFDCALYQKAIGTIS